MRISPKLIVGLVIITLGVLWTLDNMGVLVAEDYLLYWPVALIAIGAVKLREKRWFAPFAFIIAGTLLLLYNLEYIDVDVWNLWPLILVAIGIKVILESMGRRSAAAHNESGDAAATVNVFALMSGVLKKNGSSGFLGGEATAIMGGAEIDLREATIEGEAVLDTFVLWGGLEIYVPETWAVISEVTPIMGAFEDKTRPPHDSTQRLIIRGTVIMGGIDVKNNREK
ncbi:MAG TPA: DUF5668 domain-containing protein [Thermoanaerobaculia bacterium]|nr:DUF5668 domain-containing protein [Thermoanaerobaculia bacterium]